MKFQYFPNLDHLTVGCWEFFYWKMSFSRPVIVLISSLDMNISTLTYLPTIHILTSKINFWKSEFWDHLAKPLGCPLGICILLVLLLLLQAKCYVCLSLYNNWILAKGKKLVKFFWHFWHYKYISLLLRWRSKASKWWLHFLCMFKPSFLDLLFWILRQFQNIWKCRWLWSHQISRIMLYPISKMSQTRSRYNILFTYREIIILIIVSPHDLCLRAAWAGSLRDKSSKETIFKIRAQQFNVYICNVIIIT